MAKKYYAVKKGKQTGIFGSWDACKASVDGYSGAEYQGFGSREEAERYLGIFVSSKDGEFERGEDGRGGIRSHLVVYVDGSYEHGIGRYGFGCVFLPPEGGVLREFGGGNDPESAKLRNVTGEMLGAMFAVRWAIKNGFSKIELCYDYEGIEKWVTGAWKAKTELTTKYALAMRKWGQRIEICFTKVAAHTNVIYNEMADELAKKGVAEGGGIPELRTLSEYGEEEWEREVSG